MDVNDSFSSGLGVELHSVLGKHQELCPPETQSKDPSSSSSGLTVPTELWALLYPSQQRWAWLFQLMGNYRAVFPQICVLDMGLVSLYYWLLLYRKTIDSKNNDNNNNNSISHSNTFPCFTCSFPFCFSSWTKQKNKKKTKLFPTETTLPFKRAQIVAVLTTVNYVSWFSSGRNWAFKHKSRTCASIVHSLMSMRKLSFSVNQDPSQRIPSSHFWACQPDNTSLSFEIMPFP